MISFNQLKKNLQKKNESLKTIRLAILADTASQLLTQAIKGYGIEMGICFDIYEAEYDQIQQEVFNRKSALFDFKADFVFINFSTEHLLKKFYDTARADRLHFAEQEAAYIDSICHTVTTNSKSNIIINTFIEINDDVFGNYAAREKKSFIYQLRKLNMQLMELSQSHQNLYISDLLSLQSQVGYGFVFDPKMYINADMVYSLDFLPYIAKTVTDIVLSVNGIFKKCIILDLDNTLWGGIIGDDGMEGIELGTLGLGKAFSQLQRWLKELKERGILLAVCSKNTEEIAKEPFLDHPDMILRLQDIALFVANWENKVDNIIYIQSVLNIGFDSMVFIDDNPFEREMVKTAIPSITVPDMPEDPAEYLQYLRSLHLFETASLTEEDEQRTMLYQQEASRVQMQNEYANEEEFLESLEMFAEVKTFDSFTAPRIAQLTQRSNQFNLRTIRYTESEIVEIMQSPEWYTLSFTLEDKFGKHGLISAIILKDIGNGNLFIDTWIMSCRVLKRGMEKFTLNAVATLAKEKGFKKITGEYIPTKKNGLVKDHFAGLGFLSLNGTGWELNVENYTPQKNYIKSK